MLRTDYVDRGFGYENLLSIGDRPFHLLLPESLRSTPGRRLTNSFAFEEYDGTV